MYMWLTKRQFSFLNNVIKIESNDHKFPSGNASHSSVHPPCYSPELAVTSHLGKYAFEIKGLMGLPLSGKVKGSRAIDMEEAGICVSVLAIRNKEGFPEQSSVHLQTNVLCFCSKDFPNSRLRKIYTL